MQVTVMARERQIIGDTRAAVLTRYNVLNMKSKERVVVLVKPAILAAIAGSFPNEIA